MPTVTQVKKTPEINQITGIINKILDGMVMGVYLFGSSVGGGLKPHSDIDFLVITDRPMSPAVRRNLCDSLMPVSGNPAIDDQARPLEVTVVTYNAIAPWKHPAQSDFVYGEWLRDRFETGELPQPAVEPDLTIMLATALQNNRVLTGTPLNDIIACIPAKDIRRAISESLPLLLEGLQGDERNVLLTLARMWHTLVTGAIVSKDVAACWALDEIPAKYRPVLQLALNAYLGNCADNWRGCGQEVADFAVYIQNQIESALIK